MEIRGTCKFILTREGCKKGAACPFIHPRSTSVVSTASKKEKTASRKAKRERTWCDLCKVSVSDGSMEAHRNGKKHRQQSFERDVQQRKDNLEEEKRARESKESELKEQARKEERWRQRIAKDHEVQKTNELIERIRKSTQQKPEPDIDEQDRLQTRKQIASICARHVAATSDNGIDHSGDYFHQIPDEILLHLFSMLDYRDLFVLSLVNSQWLRILNDKEIWKYAPALTLRLLKSIQIGMR